MKTDNPHHPIQVAGRALCSQKINLEVPSWSLLGCRTSTKLKCKDHTLQHVKLKCSGWPYYSWTENLVSPQKTSTLETNQTEQKISQLPLKTCHQGVDIWLETSDTLNNQISSRIDFDSWFATLKLQWKANTSIMYSTHSWVSRFISWSALTLF